MKDHLGSASVITNASGVTVSGGEQRYYPYGESRLTATMITDKLFTGQREMAGLGIYHYGARFYLPKLGRFLSADTIVPSAANPQSLNRFAYVRNNPIRYNDPTGHMETDGGDGGLGVGGYTYVIAKKYGWKVKGKPSQKEVQTIYQTGLDIEHYVDGLTGGNGLEWMNEYMGGISIGIGNNDRGSSVPGSISLPNWWDGGDKGDKYYLAHELTHTWDTKTGHLGLIGIIDGPGDYLNDFINQGNGILGSGSCRFCDGSGYDHIPSSYLFTSGVMTNQDGPYGNNSTADYLAESFALNLYYPQGGHVNSTVTLWINAVISLQTSNLP